MISRQSAIIKSIATSLSFPRTQLTTFSIHFNHHIAQVLFLGPIEAPSQPHCLGNCLAAFTTRGAHNTIMTPSYQSLACMTIVETASMAASFQLRRSLQSPCQLRYSRGIGALVQAKISCTIL